MIYGIGTDIVAVPRIAALHQRYGDALARRILTASEWANYAAHAQPARLTYKSMPLGILCESSSSLNL